ncbi:MAG: hypothetical protein WAO07_14645 [Desulfobacterales bacterium]
MSSILKALKKLEDENPPQGRSVIWPSGSGPRVPIRRLDVSSGWLAVLGWGLLAAVVLFAAGGLYLFLSPTPEGDERPAEMVARPVVKPIQEPTPADLAVLPPTPPPPARKEDTPPIAPPVEKAGPTPKDAPAATQKTLPSPKASVPAAKRVSTEPRKPPPPRPPAAAPDRAAPADLPVLTTDLKLQAVSWASAPGDRLAVINGSIMREGTTLDGYLIMRIDRDEVVVRKAGEEWKLVFKLK